MSKNVSQKSIGAINSVDILNINERNSTALSKSSQLRISNELKDEFRVYKRRWIMLAIFALYAGSNSMQWIQFSIIANIIQKFYGVSSTWVDWTSMITMIVYIPLIFPASWILDKFGLRITMILGSLGTCLGAWIKVFAVEPHLFYVAFIGQSIVGASQVFVLSLPAKLAATWFGPNQVASACSIGVFGNLLGVAVGFLSPPMLVKNHDELDFIGRDLLMMFYSVAGYTTILLILIICFFQKSPPSPPSASAAIAELSSSNESPPFSKSIKNLLCNFNFLLLLISFGMIIGVFFAISTLLNPIILFHYPGAEEDAGRIGLCIVVAGMFGTICCGILLDKTRRFKEIAMAVYACSTIGMIFYTFSLRTGNIFIVYVTASLLGFFITGFLPAGFEFAAELTYPEPEGTNSGMLNASSQIFGILFTMLYGKFLDLYGDVAGNLLICGFLATGTIILGIVRSDFRRQNARASLA